MGSFIELFDSETNMDRRVFIKGVGTVSVGFIAALGLGGCDQIVEQIQNRPLRRRIVQGSADVDNDLAIYADGVAQMKALPNADPRSWFAQSAIHGTRGVAFNHCEHGSNHFFSWHRAYLFYFERIIRDLTGESDWGLPYWNWNQDQVVPPAFTDPASTLDHPRNNTDLTGFGGIQDSDLNPMMGEPNFFFFSSLIEGSPHVTPHNGIGDDMSSFGSSNDPIFWMHHNMVDYCWWKWNIELGNSAPSDPTWQNETWNHFVEGNGDPAEMSALGTLLMPLFSYRFEESAIGSFASLERTNRFAGQIDDRGRELVRFGFGPVEPARPSAIDPDLEAIEARLRKGATIREDILDRIDVTPGVRFALTTPLSLETNARAQLLSDKLMAQDDEGVRTFIRINHRKLPDATDFFVRVFINMPNANPDTSIDDPHYAGTYGFFGSAKGHEGHDDNEEGHSGGKTDFLVNASPAIERLTRQGMFSQREAISVQLVPVPVPGGKFFEPRTELDIASIDITLSRAVIEVAD